MSESTQARRTSRSQTLFKGKPKKADRAATETATISDFPILQLPEELLANIFYCYIIDICVAASFQSLSFLPDDLLGAPADGYIPPPYAWLKIRHVCHAWREIALNYPELSTHIFLTRPECVQDMLSRSGTLPLYIYDLSRNYTDDNQERVIASSKLVLKHLNRISRGRLIFLDNSMVEETQQAFQDRTCIASSLRLVFLEFIPSVSPISSSSRFPELRELSCYKFNLVMSSVPLHAPRLQILNLSECDEPTRADDLLAFLAHIPTLEYLIIHLVLLEHDDWPHLDETVPRNSEYRITLPNLRRLTIVSQHASTGLSFLNRITHPPNTSMELTFQTLSEGVHASCDCLLRLLQAKTSAWNEIEAPPMRNLSIACIGAPSDGTLSIELWKDGPKHPPSEAFTRSDPFFSLSIFCITCEQKHLLTSIVQALPPSAAAALTL